mmetsp:Transcript_18203/g.57202  ORF Transcript_18203/g.57202 Transcript_18203/m.57202 type:complete len:516 (+) Transcript_18203:294-1841(+)|eukprot:CAMPEP_0197394546 /NCGR_PEP_ID=MMETSP1165-20131217/5434_1 /TAXON_ID=284809 /ORGANISM="Chrysocystis fragilis, Strain CCMP3189" /LENGTH=515 /DNA_ID=CAMNT_0042920263 /DNA_START=246 /DNA_END=1793 /DNA_ORIENTATION=+
MRRAASVAAALAALIWPGIVPFALANGCFEAKDGEVLLDGEPFIFKGVSWYGGESDLFHPHGLWKQPIDFYLEFVADRGFNALRLPIATDVVLDNPKVKSYSYNKNQWLKGMRALEAMEYIIDKAAEYKLLVVLGIYKIHHKQWPDDGTYGDWGVNGYGETRVTEAWETLAKQFKKSWNVFAADIANEPHGSSWASGNSKLDFDAAVERIGNRIHKIAPHWLIFVEGIGSEPGYPGYTSRYNQWWGGNLCGALDEPIELDLANRVVYSPHVYGPSSFDQHYFSHKNFPDNLPKVWEDHWGFIAKEKGSPPIVIGEWGGYYEGDSKKFMDKITEYFLENIDRGIPGSFYWCLNPKSSGTGGLLEDDWKTPVESKLKVLKRLPATDLAKAFPDYKNLHTCKLSSTPSTCKKKIVDGRPKRDGTRCKTSQFNDKTDPDVMEADPKDADGGVRCCTNTKANSFCNSKCERVTYAEAERRCSDNGMRLCTADEILDGKAAGTGCKYDFLAVWTSDSASGC